MSYHTNIVALSWNIATEPKLYQKLASNPYSPASLKIISERFPNENADHVIRAIIFAEPEGKYDRNFRLLETTQKTKELVKQENINTEINKRLAQYCIAHQVRFNKLSKEFIYALLFKVVFEFMNLRQIEEKYAQNQRLNFKLSIVNLIEETMRKKWITRRRHFKGVFGVLSLLLLFYYGYTQNINQNLETKKQILGIEVQKTARAFPVRLKIPRINVDTLIEYVGITSEGVMDVPKNIINVGWFELGTPPGEIGSAVIDGHFNGKNGEPGVFADLYQLTVGDKIYIEDDKGVSTAFIVRQSRTYDPGYAEEVFSLGDSAHLNLITCDGIWDKAKKSYSKRLVVFADLIVSE